MKVSLQFKSITFLVIILISVCAMNAYSYWMRKIFYPKCNMPSEVISTGITFLIDKRVKEKNIYADVIKRVNAYVEYSNQTLENSCIPIRRKIDKIESVELGSAPYNAKDFSIMYEKALNSFSDDERDKIIMDPTRFVVVMFDSLKDSSLGLTFPYVTPRLVAISSFAAAPVMEHELGHLGLAGHEISYSQDYNVGPSIAHAYHCGRYRSIMNENVNDGISSPFYSDPNITSGGDSCGNESVANNSEQLRRWAVFVLRKTEIYNDFKTK